MVTGNFILAMVQNTYASNTEFPQHKETEGGGSLNSPENVAGLDCND